ncbi:leucine-rich repeat domain-containing protein [Longirhabdus pacifica]|uniref:leucine-rich repeat domain-containing protein n=1 Tax=Longirhabdus pacifica TaxID=2305227 RepID=UPI001009231A|nr:leucine-rich repeat domain-containing protein [Longirhabdus pacifica]
MINLRSDVKNDAYYALIDYAIEHADTFMLADHHYTWDVNSDYRTIFKKLEPYLIHLDDQQQTNNAISYSKGAHYYTYRCCQEAGHILKEVANSLFSWEFPSLPEDLSFFYSDGKPLLTNIAHEHMGRIYMDEDEAILLSNRIKGLFLGLERHKQFDCFLQDAIVHQPESLSISSFGIHELPNEICELKNLKHLFIFEQHLFSLPEKIYDIQSLETLTIYTANFKGFSPRIKEWVNLRGLIVGCCSYHDVPDTIITRKDVALCELPKEIGALKKLEHLEIHFSNVASLPDELQHATNLKYISLHNSNIKEIPIFLKKMKHLEHIDIEITS